MRCAAAIVSIALLLLSTHSAQAQDAATTAKAQPAETERDAEALSAEAAVQMQIDNLEQSLQTAQHERADTSLVLPWVLTVSGLAALAVGLVVGVSGAMSCEDSCHVSAWPAWLVLGGATVSTAGTIWLSLAARDMAELDAQVHDLERQLERQRWQKQGQQAGNGPRAMLWLRGSL